MTMTELAAIREDHRDIKKAIITLTDSINELTNSISRMEERDKHFTHRLDRVEERVGRAEARVTAHDRTLTENNQVARTIKTIATIVFTSFVSGGVTILLVSP